MSGVQNVLYLFVIGFICIHLQVALDDVPKYPWLEQMVRQDTLNSNCDMFLKNSYFNISSLDHILVDHNHKLLYCYVPKVACTNWKRVFMVLTNQFNVTNLVDIPSFLVHMENSTTKLSSLDENLAKDCLNTYTTFLMVRHPFERLLSAYRNKFTGNASNYFHKRYGRYITKKYRENASEIDKKNGNNVTFREFVKYLLIEGILANEHWAPIYNLCHPCNVNYTFIGHYETLDQDTKTVLDMVHAPPIVFPATRVANTGNILREYFQQLSLLEIKDLYRVYMEDFKLFGYNLEQLLGYDLA